MEDISQDAAVLNRDQLAGFLESDPRVIFPRRFRMLREQSGLTQQQIAFGMGVAGFRLHRSAIAKIEAGERPVLLGEAVVLARILGVDLSELLLDPEAGTGRERAHSRQRLEAQLAVRSLEREAEERSGFLDEASALLGNTLKRLEAARRRLAALEDERAPAEGGYPPQAGYYPELPRPKEQ